MYPEHTTQHQCCANFDVNTFVAHNISTFDNSMTLTRWVIRDTAHKILYWI